MGRVLGYIEKGRSEGAKVALGGQRILSESGGYYIEPTVFDGVKNDMTIAQEEIFGPVLSTISFGDAEEAVKIGNDTIYGLAAAVWTSDIKKAHRSEEHTPELQSLMRSSYDVFCLKKKNRQT